MLKDKILSDTYATLDHIDVIWALVSPIAGIMVLVGTCWALVNFFSGR